MAVTAQMVKDLREKTGAGMMDCKNALAESSGDFEKAQEWLRKKGLSSVSKRSGKVASEGIVHSYIHTGGKVGVLLELNCETDFVARNEELKNLAKDIAMHVAWAAPKYLSREEVPQSVLDSENDIYKTQIQANQEKVADKIMAGKLEKFFEENCLLEQVDAKETSGKKKIQDSINDLSARLGEKLVLRRFARYQLGEGIEKQVTNFADEVAQAANLK